MRPIFTFPSTKFHTDVFVGTIGVDLAKIITEIQHLTVYKVLVGNLLR